MKRTITEPIGKTETRTLRFERVQGRGFVMQSLNHGPNDERQRNEGTVEHHARVFNQIKLSNKEVRNLRDYLNSIRIAND